jgi:thymidylate synthase (FAD)
MAHCISPEAEKILDKKFPVLNKGFVRLVDYLGNDDRIVQSARVSYGQGTKTYREDKGLINYLLRNEHTSPFEQVVLTFHMKLPIFIARQWIRHRTARVNEISGRYSVMADEFYLPAARDIAFQSMDNKQGRSTDAVPKALQAKVLGILTKGQKAVYRDYQSMLKDNIARELARINLPLSLYTEWFWQIDLNNLMHFLLLRMNAHAQKEIRDYAESLYEITKKVCPLAMNAFDEHMLHSVKFSQREMQALRKLIQGEPSGLEGREQQRIAAKINGQSAHM